MRTLRRRYGRSVTGDRRIYIQLDGEPVSVIVKKGQAPRAAVVQSLKRRFGADVTMWPEGRPSSGVPGETFVAKWYDAKSKTFRENHVEIWDSEVRQ